MKRLDIDSDGKIGFADYLYFMELGKNNKINNSTKLNRLNYTLPNNFDSNNENNTRNNNSVFFNRSYFDNNEENSKIRNKGLYYNYDYKSDLNSKANFLNNDKYSHLSYKIGEDPDIDSLRFNTSGLNKDSLRKNSQLDKINSLEEKNVLKNSHFSCK